MTVFVFLFIPKHVPKPFLLIICLILAYHKMFQSRLFIVFTYACHKILRAGLVIGLASICHKHPKVRIVIDVHVTKNTPNTPYWFPLHATKYSGAWLAFVRRNSILRVLHFLACFFLGSSIWLEDLICNCCFVSLRNACIWS